LPKLSQKTAWVFYFDSQCRFNLSRFVVVGRHGDEQLVELRRDPRGEEKKSLKMMRKRTTVAETGGGSAARNGSINLRQMVGQLRYENQEFRELLIKVFR